MAKTTDDIKKVMARIFEVDPSSLHDTIRQDEVENWDSLRHMNLILGLEEEFGVEFTPEQSVEILSLPLIKVTLQELGVSFS